jgi:hypothetical protein
MRKLILGIMILGSFTSFAEVQSVNCSVSGNFTDYKIGILGTRKVNSRMSSVCPGTTPRVQINSDGTPFTASCGYMLSSDAGYSFSIETQESSPNEIKIRILIAQAKNHETNENQELFVATLNQEHIGFSRILETNVVAFKESKRKITKLESINISCGLDIIN